MVQRNICGMVATNSNDRTGDEITLEEVERIRI